MPSSITWGDFIPAPGSPPPTGAALVWNGSSWVADTTTYRATATLIVNADVDAAAAIVPTKFSQVLWATYVPALTAVTTNPTLGTGSTALGRYVRQANRLIVAHIRLIFGTGGVGAGSGQYIVSLPVNTNSFTHGSGYLLDSSANALFLIVAYQNSASTVSMIAETVSKVSDSSPFVWAASDEINMVLTYEATS